MTAEFVDRGIQALLKTDMAVWPKFLAKDFAGNHAAGIFEQRDQNFKRLAFKRNAHAMLAQFPGSDIDLKSSEAQHRSREKLLAHWRDTPFTGLSRPGQGGSENGLADKHVRCKKTPEVACLL